LSVFLTVVFDDAFIFYPILEIFDCEGLNEMAKLSSFANLID